MHRVRFGLHPPHAHDPGEVRIIIDERDLIELVLDVELPFATAEGSPGIAGGYAGLAPAAVSPPSRHFLGEPEWSVYGASGRVQVLECEGCREPGCWPLFCRIDVTGNRVRWSGFEQPHRADGEHRWSYEALGPFDFDRAQYDRALHALGETTSRS